MMTLCGLLIHCLHESVALSMPLYINPRKTSTPYFMSLFLAWHKELSNPGCRSFPFVDSLSGVFSILIHAPMYEVPIDTAGASPPGTSESRVSLFF
ncbi:hypothetical protein ARMGADRAFT_793170 [Armillaria gallica]|uniref:Secreted protein n=1 Tax=Armillaria gallica TaxID=47427 RepID=A0A2H3DJ65_ARMGA|nr:hypothetical protein ARMGADRAFT_793170 [Armillaria gallica]